MNDRDKREEDRPDVWHPPVMFTGMPRSGTTLLGRIAQEYLDVAAVNEGTFMLWLARLSDREASWQNDTELDAVLSKLASRHYFTLLYSAIDKPIPQDLAQQLKALAVPPTVQSIGRAVLILTRNEMGRSKFGHESPAMIIDPSAVMTVFPTTRWVHIVRDPRDTTASVLQVPWGPNNAFASAERWSRKVGRMRELGARLGKRRFLEFRYEDLLQEPEETMRALMEFVCGEIDTQRLNAFVSEMSQNPRSLNFGKWQRSLSFKQVRIVESVAGEEMLQHGYEPMTHVRSHGAAQAIIWRAHNRLVQVSRILSGKLAIHGGAKHFAQRSQVDGKSVAVNNSARTGHSQGTP